MVGTSNAVSATAKLPSYSLSLSASVQDSVTTYNTYKPNTSTYISYLSKPKFTFSASSSTGSTYGRSISYTVKGTSATSPYTENNYAGGTYTIVASDGRESNSSTPSMTNVPYFKPTLNVSAVRPTPTGDAVNISVSGQYYSGIGLTNLLTAGATVTYTEEGGTQQTSTVTLSTSTSGNIISYSGTLSLSNMDYQKSITWSATLSDLLGITATSSGTLTRGEPVWNAYRENNTNYMNINGALRVNNHSVVCENGNIYNGDANNYKTAGIYYFATGNSNVPESWMKIIVTGNGNDTAQIGVGISSGKTYVRKSNNGNWDAWKELSYENSNGTPIRDMGSQSLNLNDIKNSCCFYAGSSTTNRPTSSNGYFESQRCDGSNYVLQRYTPVSSSGICYERQCAGGTWGAWKPVYSNGVIEEFGNSGIWHYRKWSDGYAELWGTTSSLSFNVTTQWGSVYESPDLSPNISNFPFSFVEAPHVSVSMVGGNMNFLSIEQGSPAVNKVNQIFVTRPDSKTGFTGKLYLYITGKWK